jgi:DNA-binding PadR family transcriptional regulator
MIFNPASEAKMHRLFEDLHAWKHHCGGRRGRRGFGHSRGGIFGGEFGWHSFRAGRKLGADDLHVLILSLLAEKPAHGYEIIKAIDERSAGFYSPSPGMVYPALTYLEEIGYASVQAEGTKKLYEITPEGREHLERNRSRVDTMLAQLRWVAGKMEHVREAFGRHGDHHGDDMTPELDEARARLRALLARKLGSSEAEQRRIAEILKRAAEEIERS